MKSGNSSVRYAHFTSWWFYNFVLIPCFWFTFTLTGEGSFCGIWNVSKLIFVLFLHLQCQNYSYICVINYNFKFGYLFMHQPAVELVPILYYKNTQCTGSLFTCPYENRVTVSVFNALLLIFLLTCICMCGRS